MKNVAALAIFGLVLIILVHFYLVLIEFGTMQPIRHGGKISEVLAFLGYLALLPFFVKFHRRGLFS
jgi:hypothetical protein